MKAYAQQRKLPHVLPDLTRPGAKPLARPAVHPIMQLQRTIGNQSVLRLLHANAAAREVRSGTSTRTAFAQNFGSLPVGSKSPVGLQPKLSVNTPGDIYEQEADRVAAQVTSMTGPELQRSCSCAGACPACSMMPNDHEHLQMKSVQASDSLGMVAPPIVHETLGSPGQPLDRATREFMEPRFGHDFSRVRVHTDGRAAASARAVNAVAYTVGRNIVFAPGSYRPQTTQGLSLLAHELTHVVQQGGSPLHSPAGPRVHLSGMPQPTLTRTSAQTVQRKTEFEECAAPSEVAGPDTSRKFGDFAEAIIVTDYCAKSGCNGVDEYFDVRGKSPRAYIAFIIKKNYGTVPEAKLITLPNWLKRPDIMSHKIGLKEFYEIKPWSAAGQAAGKMKIKEIEAYVAATGLPYVAGVTYTPTQSIPLGIFPISGIEFEVFLKVERSLPGLVLYKICTKYSVGPSWVEKGVNVIGYIALAVLAFVAALLGLRGPSFQLQYEIMPISPGGVMMASLSPNGKTSAAGDGPKPLA